MLGGGKKAKGRHWGRDSESARYCCGPVVSHRFVQSVKRIIEWNRLLKPRWLKWISISIVAVFFAVGLWPLDFSPKNHVEWLRGEKGLRFMGESVMHGRTVGGYVSSLGLPVIRDARKRGFTIEIWLRALEDAKGGVPSFLSFVDHSCKVVLSLGQWKSSLIIRWPVAGYDVRKKWKEIGAKDALPKGVRRLITVASDQKGTFIYLDGRLGRAYPDLNLNDTPEGMKNCSFILGNSPTGKASWSGDVYGLALYDAALNETEALESFQRWTTGENKENSHSREEVALYLFDEGAGNRVRNALGTTAPLVIPDHPAFPREVLGPPLINKYNRLSYVKDGAVNILGFIPFGFFLSLWMIKTRPWSRATIILIAVGLGTLVSLSIELVQVLIPVRDSSLMDLVCNTFGAGMGAGISLSVGRSEFIAESKKGRAIKLGSQEAGRLGSKTGVIDES
jgi:hypothetical protein